MARVRSIEMMQGKIALDATAAATILVEPAIQDARGLGLRDFRQGRRFITLGEEAAETALPRLNAALPWLQQTGRGRS